jgi:hypothetical protein
MALVLGGGPAACRPLHDGMALSRAQAPPTCPAAFSQADLKKWKLLGHRIICLCFGAQVQTVNEKRFETPNNWE